MLKLQTLLILALVLALRLPFLHQAIQGDDVYYIAGAEHAQIDPLHPNHARYMFLGEMVDMRGNPHPFYSWFPAALLALVGDVREVPFHLGYIVFSLIAAMAMWSLSLRFSNKPFLATLLFLAVPAFVVNGNSFEADVPFLAFWLASIALFVRAVDAKLGALLLASGVAAALAAICAYQAVLLTPVLLLYLYYSATDHLPVTAPSQSRLVALASRDRKGAVLATLAAPAALLLLQIWERIASGAVPASVLAGYLQTHNFEALTSRIRGASALIVHFGWIVSPLVILAAMKDGARWRWMLAGVVAAAAALHDYNPLFWIGAGCSVWLLTACLKRSFLENWVLLFLCAALPVAFAGSARYLLPIAAPVVILVADFVGTRIAIAGFAAQLVLSLGLAAANYQHWDGYRKFAAALPPHGDLQHVWINSEWGLRYYLEADGALTLGKDQAIQPGDMVVTSELASPLKLNLPTGLLMQREIRPGIPLRLIALDGRSAYSSAARGLLPFEIGRGPVDRVRAEIVIAPELSYIDPRDPKAASQMLRGLDPDMWMQREALVLLKVPPGANRLSVSLYISDATSARTVQLKINDRFALEKTFPGPGTYELAATIPPGLQTVTVTIDADKTFRAPPDLRDLGMQVIGIGFR